MATIGDITNTPKAGLTWIDALLNRSPDWNYLTTDGTAFRTTINYTFSTASGNEGGAVVTAFNAAQIAAARAIISYVTQLTGIAFAETSNGNTADIHFAQRDLSVIDPDVAGLC